VLSEHDLVRALEGIGLGAPVRFDEVTGSTQATALAMAAVTGFAMGVDFPRSNRRFSRLAPSDEMDGPAGLTPR